MMEMRECIAEPHADTEPWHKSPRFGSWKSKESSHPENRGTTRRILPFPRKLPHSKSETEEQFDKLAEKWSRDTAYLSSVHTIISHPAYLQIIAIGKEVLPFIFKDLRKGPKLWFWALEALTGQNPISPEDAGKISKMTSAWLKWADENWI